jgi:cellobiose phosphorylase
MIYHGLFGMNFEADGIHFAPVVPEQFSHLSLTGVKYRAAKLKITVQGSGTEIREFKLDGQRQSQPFFAASNRGEHQIEIVLMNPLP